MKVEEVSTKEELHKYLENHRTVKNSLIKNVIEKCGEVYDKVSYTTKVIYDYNFFNKLEKVLEFCSKEEKDGIINELIDLGVRKNNIQLLSEIDKWFINKEDEIANKIIQDNLELRLLFDCLVYFQPTSKVYIEAKKIIKKSDHSDDELIILINSLFYLSHGGSGAKLMLMKDEFGKGMISNSAYEVQEPIEEIMGLKNFLLRKAVNQLSDSWKFILLIDFISQHELELIEEHLDPEKHNWIKLEIKLRELVPATEVPALFSFEDYFPQRSFQKIWEEFETTDKPFIHFALFQLLKLKIFLIQKGIIQDDLNYEKVLNNPLTAYYIKFLHDSGIIKKIPHMDDLFKWPTLSFNDVEKYVNNYKSEFKELSPLGFIGYSVGKNSKLSKSKRHKLLEKAFLKKNFSHFDDYDWGKRGTPTRLKSLAFHLANQIRIKQRDSRNYSVAIKDWKEDLNYLKSMFYDEQHADKFIWPDIY